ncbi:hypothetical protein QR680_017742 [Steinernema hermaphroditum]|uniref:Uncharacterized protein n=1 Tax=Steinernema hermaphroditum TaxID=289476 RepID=A0AA39LPN4_9BILA|nr:hypothetical protein QR680_017742 [Steinernema hermaphroditum]
MNRDQLRSAISSSFYSSSKSSNSGQGLFLEKGRSKTKRVGNSTFEHLPKIDWEHDRRQEFNADDFFCQNFTECIEDNERAVVRLQNELREIEDGNEQLRQRIQETRNVWNGQLMQERARYMQMVTLMAMKVAKAKSKVAKQECHEQKRRHECIWGNLLKMKELQGNVGKMEKTIEQHSKRASRLWMKVKQTENEKEMTISGQPAEDKRQYNGSKKQNPSKSFRKDVSLKKH